MAPYNINFTQPADRLVIGSPWNVHFEFYDDEDNETPIDFTGYEEIRIVVWASKNDATILATWSSDEAEVDVVDAENGAIEITLTSDMTETITWASGYYFMAAIFESGSRVEPLAYGNIYTMQGIVVTD